MKVNNKKIAFIYCVTNELYYNESCYYLNKLVIPDGYQIEILAVQDAKSMCSGYQEAMESSDAKYKVYLHQDVFVRDKFFLVHLLDIFASNSQIGMIGMIGGTHLSKTGMALLDWDVGLVDCRDPDMAVFLQCQDVKKDTYTVVEAIDGLLIATQYDLPWRDDLFHDFDFYDVSQAIEFRKAGYDVVVPYQSKPWVIHDCNFSKLKNYEKNRQICLAEYPEFFYAEGGFEPEYHDEWDQLSGQLAKQIKECIHLGEWGVAGRILSEYKDMSFKDSLLERMLIMYDIYEKDCINGKTSFFLQCDEYHQMEYFYLVVRFLLRRIELFDDEEEYSELIELIQEGKISDNALIIIIIHSVVDKKKVLKKIKKYYKKNSEEERKINKVMESIPDKLPTASSKMVKKRKSGSH